MLSTFLPPRRPGARFQDGAPQPAPWQGHRLRSCLLLAALGVAGGVLAAAAAADPAQAAEPGSSPDRPADLVILEERDSLQGHLTVGVFGLQKDPSTPDLWRVNIWRQWPDRVVIATDVVRCDTKAPQRITGDRQRVIVRSLNPGGAISRANRLDHMVWWASCFPQQAGQDPAGLAATARQLGYSGQLPESEQVVATPPR
jgi:hypothetical protein